MKNYRAQSGTQSKFAKCQQNEHTPDNRKGTEIWIELNTNKNIPSY